MLSNYERPWNPVIMRSLRSMAAIVSVLTAGAGNAWTQPSLHIQSPDGHVSATVRIREGHVFWETSLDSHVVLDSAPLGIGVAGEPVAPVLRFGEKRRYAVDDRYPMYGVH